MSETKTQAELHPAEVNRLQFVASEIAKQELLLQTMQDGLQVFQMSLAAKYGLAFRPQQQVMQLVGNMLFIKEQPQGGPQWTPDSATPEEKPSTSTDAAPPSQT